MLDNLCMRAVIPATVAITGFVIVCSLLLYSVIKDDMKRDAVIHGTDLAHTLVNSTRYAMLHDDREALSHLISNVGGQQGVEHVRIFNKKGVIAFSTNTREVTRYVDKNTAGCNACHAGSKLRENIAEMEQARNFTDANGTPVMGVMAAIRNEAECSNSACHVHSPDHKFLGVLDVELNQVALQNKLAALRWRMFTFTLMVLCLTVGGVAALLARSVFIPLTRLIGFTEQAVGGKIPADLPEVKGELAVLAAHVLLLDQRRRHAERELTRHTSAPCDRNYPSPDRAELYESLRDKKSPCPCATGVPAVAATDSVADL